MGGLHGTFFGVVHWSGTDIDPLMAPWVESGHKSRMALPFRLLIGMTAAALLTGFVALMAIVATNFWLGERAQVYFDTAIAARDTRVAAVELRNAVQTAEFSQHLHDCPLCSLGYEAFELQSGDQPPRSRGRRRTRVLPTVQ